MSKWFGFEYIRNHKKFYLFGVKLFSIKLKVNYNKLHKKYEKYAEILKNKSRKEKINLTFMIESNSMFPSKPLLDYVLKHFSDKYNCKILLTPCLAYDEISIKNIIDNAYDELSNEYGNEMVLKGDKNTNPREFTDIMICSQPYDTSYSQFDLYNLYRKGIIPVYINYGYFVTKHSLKVYNQHEYNLFYKIFTEDEFTHKCAEENMLSLKDNLFLSGYCKMDGYSNIKRTNEGQKTVIIAPHHSVSKGFNDAISLSNFERYSDFFLSLPEKYPEINWILRPHPILFVTLAKEEKWGREKIQRYIEKFTSYSNAKYYSQGDYFQLFSNSDGLINDCGSYLAEYFFTGKPQCYMLHSKEDIENKFVPLGQNCLEHCYLTYNEQDIANFIENTIINNSDVLKEKRYSFFENKLKNYYPNTAKRIAEVLNKISLLEEV